MKLTTLYKARSDGGVQTWEIEVEGERYRTHSGIQGGAVVVSEWTVAKGKNTGRANATTPEQQALAEAQSTWQRKRDRGYYESPEAALAGEGYFKCMLAKDFKDRADKGKVTYPVSAQPKLDGMRYIDLPRGPISRENKPIVTAPHIREVLEQIRAQHPGIIFDGELYCDRLSDNFDELMSIAKKQKPTAEDLAKSAEWLEYHIYDVPSHPGKFSERYSFLRDVLTPHLHEGSPLRLVETHVVHDQERLDELFEHWLSRGYEGQIVRLDAPYANKRSDVLLKRKLFMDAEFVITSITEGKGGRAGQAGRVELALPDGRTFGVDPMGKVAYRRRLWELRDEIIGKRGTVKFGGYTPDGIPRWGKLKVIRDYE